MYRRMLYLLTTMILLLCTSYTYAETTGYLIVFGDKDFYMEEKAGFNYYRPGDDISGHETTIGYLFNNDPFCVGVVTKEKYSAYVRYYPIDNTSESVDLSLYGRINKCLTLEFEKNAPFFEKPFYLSPLTPFVYYICQTDKLSETSIVDYYYFFFFVKNGIITLTSNSFDDGAADFIWDVAYSVQCNDTDNPFIN